MVFSRGWGEETTGRQQPKVHKVLAILNEEVLEIRCTESIYSKQYHIVF